MTEQMPEPCLDHGPQLAALLDGELSSVEQAQTEAHLRQCPACAASLRAQRGARSALRGAAGALPTPVGLRAQIGAALDRAEAQRRRRSRLALLGGIAAVLAVITVVGLLRLQGPPSNGRVLAAAAAAHQRETLGPDPVSLASSDPSAVAVWVRSSSGRQIDIPSLAAEGYQLLGARAEPSLAHGAFSLVYDGPGGRVTCAVLPVIEPLGAHTSASSSPAFYEIQSSGASVVGWLETDTTYVLVGNLSSASLLSLAHAAAQQ